MSNNLLHELDYLPEGLLDCSASELHKYLQGPSLIHLQGRRQEPLFVSVLLHGNEPAGWQAIQLLLRRYQNEELPRCLSLFIGNISAAKEGLRRLNGQPDYNRIWCPPDQGEMTDEHRMTEQIVTTMRDRKPFASIDIHNNTGINPHYGCVNRVDNRFLWLATYFSRTVVYFIRPKGVQSAAFAEFCPAVTVECGQPGQRYGVEHAAEFLDALIHLAVLPEKAVPEHDIDVFHTVAIVKVPETISFGFAAGELDCQIQFVNDLDHMNFRELSPRTILADVKNDSETICLEVIDDDGQDRWNDFFEIREGKLCTVQPVMPSMLTLDERVIRQDCLCYLMERMPV